MPDYLSDHRPHQPNDSRPWEEIHRSGLELGQRFYVLDKAERRKALDRSQGDKGVSLWTGLGYYYEMAQGDDKNQINTSMIKDMLNVLSFAEGAAWGFYRFSHQVQDEVLELLKRLGESNFGYRLGGNLYRIQPQAQVKLVQYALKDRSNCHSFSYSIRNTLGYNLEKLSSEMQDVIFDYIISNKMHAFDFVYPFGAGYAKFSESLRKEALSCGLSNPNFGLGLTSAILYSYPLLNGQEKLNIQSWRKSVIQKRYPPKSE